MLLVEERVGLQPMRAVRTPRKICGRCKESLPLSSFYKLATSPDGRWRYCKACRNKKPSQGANFVTYRRVRDGKEQIVTRTAKAHGESKTPLYRLWKAMVRRCESPAAHNYRWYGGRGITVCDEWRKDFLVFAAWAREHGYEYGMQVDRIDNEKGYSPENCRWIARLENLKNRRAYLPAELETALLEEAARRGAPPYTVIREAVAAYLGVQVEGRVS